ncbi:hypothetical protein H632_c320p2 [Helicosporidium sp. ATCC 50920]|nr:hypothetical protein H632_c320p2 [Helicosporidium sp. ATCC 50920]|eukprot:KDD76194.1 hypothetical protein H632_c320p2 [Helicosporidium sp. ATCC 50920]
MKKCYEDAKYTCSKKTFGRICKAGPQIIETLDNTPTKKTAFSEMLEEYARHMVPCINAVLQLHTNKGFRGLKFKRYRACQEALNSVFTKEAGRKTIFGFGSWSNNDPGDITKGHPAGSVRALKERLCYYYPVVPSNEHRASQLHHRCHTRMDGQRLMKTNHENGTPKSLILGGTASTAKTTRLETPATGAL